MVDLLLTCLAPARHIYEVPVYVFIFSGYSWHSSVEGFEHVSVSAKDVGGCVCVCSRAKVYSWSTGDCQPIFMGSM